MGVSSKTRRAVGDLAASASGLLILLFALVALDDRFRERLTGFAVGGHGADDLASFGQRVRDLVLFAAQVARDQGLDHLPVMIFMVVAIVLVAFLLRL